MASLCTYSSLTRVTGNGEAYVQVRESVLHEILRSILGGVEFDEQWYRMNYRDIDEAIELGRIGSAREHYISTGYFEGRFPRPIPVDEEWYIEQYSDVAEAISKGYIESAKDHFEKSGFQEGRLPHEGWTL